MRRSRKSLAVVPQTSASQGKAVQASTKPSRAKFVHFADWLPPNADHLFDVSEINQRSKRCDFTLGATVVEHRAYAPYTRH